MKRYLLKFSYIGTGYRGSQKMNNSNMLDIDTVQGAIESSLFPIKHMFENNINLVMAGRTDAGVHALCSAAHVDLKLNSGYIIDNNEQVSLMNRNLIKCGHEIRIFSFNDVENEFHARFSAKARKYLYRILISKYPDNHQIPISENYRTLHIHSKPYFDIERMQNGVELFRGTKDFKTFSSGDQKYTKNVGMKNFIRTLDIIFEESDPLMSSDLYSENFVYWNIIFTSKSFLYNQIRRIVGALIALGYNIIKEEDIIQMLQVPAHNNWDTRIKMAQPHGLYLLNVEYDKADRKV